jgi:hypothetical protein
MTGSLADHVTPQPFFATVAASQSPLDRFLKLFHLERQSFILICFLLGSVILIGNVILISTSHFLTILIRSDSYDPSAYLTNPNETSFRKFVTELAFRRHLTKLSDGQIGQDISQDNASPCPPGGEPAGTHSPTLPIVPLGPGFHFSNRAKVSLRTPDHIFRSFILFTLVIVTPVSPSDTPSAKGKHGKPLNMLEGSWYIGAFGHWWIGGVLDFPRLRKEVQNELLGKEEGSTFRCDAGILGIRSLDRPATDGTKLLHRRVLLTGG